MKKILECEENLSDEFLDEHVSVSSVKKLSHLEENMSNSAFHSEASFRRSHKSCTPRVDCNNPDAFSMHKESGMVWNPFHSEKMISEFSPRNHNLQSDIKELLHQIMNLRERSHHHLDIPPKDGERKRDGNARRKAYVKEITMKDIEKPQISD
ncbi:unnamed protein product [Moneuplotes crassus]|uniref:Uncharacterized protein n=1 Tax=Euplotes crassus TaxID=5936 RepID=A0AAD1UKW9_EUPCR|nr:unnamed protein product [Moneuplotes crassus]